MLFLITNCLLLLLRTVRASAGEEHDEDEGPLVIGNINVFNQHAVNMNGIGPWTARLEMSMTEGSPCFGSHLSVELDKDKLLLRHCGAAFVGIFRDGQHIESLYPPQKVLAADEDHLPTGKDNDGEYLSVQPDDILFLVLPHMKDWSMKPIDLIGAMQGVDTSTLQAFSMWAEGICKFLRNNKATILMAAIRRKSSAVAKANGYRIIHSQDYEAFYSGIRPVPSFQCTITDMKGFLKHD
jgi:hypothetical protein